MGDVGSTSAVIPLKEQETGGDSAYETADIGFSFLKAQSPNLMITVELREWRGRAIPVEDEQIHDIVDDLHRKYIDVEVEVEFKPGPYDGTRSLDTKRFRVVGIRNEDADDYHLYITNLPREEFLPADLATLYGCR